MTCVCMCVCMCVCVVKVVRRVEHYVQDAEFEVSGFSVFVFVISGNFFAVHVDKIHEFMYFFLVSPISGNLFAVHV